VPLRGGLVRRQVGQMLGHTGDALGQIVYSPPGDELLVEVILLERGEALQLGVGLGQGQYGWVARRNRFDLGIGEFLAANVFRTAGGVIARNHLRVMWSTTLRALCGAIGYVSGRRFDR